MKLRRGLAKSVLISAAAVAITACSPLADGHGYVPEQSALDDVRIGQDTQETVALLVGRPSTQGIVDETGWYYVRSDYERVLWRAPVEVDRQVVTISFADNGTVSNIERFGLEEGRVVRLSRRVTDGNTAGIGFLQQLFSNIGNFDAGNFLGGDG
ncbi:MAG: outer membrane protein assembly factor BamE [Pseudomonadota bacterium]